MNSQETIDTLLKRKKTMEAIDRLSRNDDFRIYLEELRDIADRLQDQHNHCDFTKPIPSAVLQGGLNTIKKLLQQVDNIKRDIVFLEQKAENQRKEAVTGAAKRHPVSEALPPREG